MAEAVFERYDALLIDLDGVLYRGDEPVAGAAAVLERVRAAGRRVVFLTNNSSRTPEDVAGKLRGMAIPADASEVLTSSLATAALLRREVTGGPRTAFVIGGRGIREALESAGVRLVDRAAHHADLVVVGWDPGATYDDLRTAGLLVQRGARLIGTNPDGSYPASDGLWPGAGALLAAVVATTGADPTVVGKPAAPMFDAAVELARARSPLVIGDRLDTDIAGAAAMGLDSLLVLTGAARPSDLIPAPTLPTYLGSSVAAVERDIPRVDVRAAAEPDRHDVEALVHDAGLPVQQTPAAGDSLVGVRASGSTGDIVVTATTFRIGENAVLRAVAVRTDLRGSGLGTLMTAAAARRALENGAARVFAFTETAERFFTGLGFRPVERSELPPDVAGSEHATGACATATALVFDPAGTRPTPPAEPRERPVALA